MLHNSIKTGNGIAAFHRARNVSIISGNQTRLPSPAAIRFILRLELRNNFNCTINPQQAYEPNHQAVNRSYRIRSRDRLDTDWIVDGFAESLQEIGKHCGVYRDRNADPDKALAIRFGHWL
ncbi:MAG: hypothetical protein DMG16_28880 [Acidobacteria bacterium]|nr:MAG: hypothetical protein DMG16_28880 [Acidobacteriota bacterium]